MSIIPLQPSCAPVTLPTRPVWQLVNPLKHARMGYWAHWTQSSAKCWVRAACARRAPFCTGATRHSASLRTSVVGLCPPQAAPPSPVSHWCLLCFLKTMMEATLHFQVLVVYVWMRRFIAETVWSLVPVPQYAPTAACTDSTGVPRALGETWNSSLSGCCQQQCQAPDTIIPVDLDCPGPRPESCPRFGEVILLQPTEDPCCLGSVCGESHS